MTFLGILDLSQAIPRKLKEILGKPDWFYFFMISFGVSDLFKAISREIKGNMRKPEEIPGNPDWFYYFMIC